MDRINELEPEIIFPGHQDVIYNPQERINQIKDHHDKRLAEILKVIKDKPMTPYRISKIHFGEDLDEINSFLALSEVLGHLLYLEDKEQVKTIEKNEQILYYS